jgi:hypothetical protein
MIQLLCSCGRCPTGAMSSFFVKEMLKLKIKIMYAFIEIEEIASTFPDVTESLYSRKNN